MTRSGLEAQCALNFPIARAVTRTAAGAVAKAVERTEKKQQLKRQQVATEGGAAISTAVAVEPSPEADAPPEAEELEEASVGGGATLEQGWVQCESCDAWRPLPNTVDCSALDDGWTCAMATWVQLSCSVSDGEYAQLLGRTSATAETTAPPTPPANAAAAAAAAVVTPPTRASPRRSRRDSASAAPYACMRPGCRSGADILFVAGTSDEVELRVRSGAALTLFCGACFEMSGCRASRSSVSRTDWRLINPEVTSLPLPVPQATRDQEARPRPAMTPPSRKRKRARQGKGEVRKEFLLVV